jgi:hypothetical protein
MKSRRKFLTLSVGMATETALRFQMAGSGNPMAQGLRPLASKYGRLRDVNTTDILDAIRLGCSTMQNIFNADDNNLPFMLARVRPDVSLAFSGDSDAHLPGRHLNALLSAEATAGITLNEDAIDRHRRAAFLSFSGPIALPLSRTSLRGPRINFAAHNLREGLHALYSLVKYRRDEKARRIAEACIAAIFDLWDPMRGWDHEQLRRHGIIHIDRNQNFVRTLPRILGPLVKYYRATGYGPALELAVTLKDKLLAEHFAEDGEYSIAIQGTHGHSIACVLSSLAQMAELTQDAVLLNRVKKFFDNGMWKLRDQVGWVVEKTGDSAVQRPDVGEGNSSGDLIESALILGRFGCSEYFEDAERIIRCHILPSQLRDIRFVEDPPNPKKEDGKREVACRLQGAWGHPAPYAHEPLELEGFAGVMFTLDIVGGVVASLCEAYRNVATFDVTGHHVNLLFDHDTDTVNVESLYTHPNLRVTLKKPGPLWIRLPSWVDRRHVMGDGTAAIPRFSGSYLLLNQQPAGQPVTVHYDLPLQTIVLKHRTRNIRTRLRGDQVVAMDSFGADLTFFDSFEN